MIIKKIDAIQTWKLRHEVMWPEMDLDFIKLPKDDAGTHFGLFVDEKLLSVVSLFQTDIDVLQFRKLATKVSDQGKGYGSKLLNHLIHYAKEQHAKTLWCNARHDKLDFYKKFDFIATEQTFIKQDIAFVILQKVL